MSLDGGARRVGDGAAPTKATALAPQERRGTTTLLVIAGIPNDKRSRWIERLGKDLAVTEVTERKSLDHVVATLRPAVLVVDLALPGLRGVRGLARVQRLSPSTKIVALTAAPDEREGLLALTAGARGYCERTIDPESLGKAVATVQKGEIWAPRRLVPTLVSELVTLIGSRKRTRRWSSAEHRLRSLTRQQRSVADLISRGASNKEVATRLRITERTVKAHLTEAFRRAGVSDRLQLALLLKTPSLESR
jgi:DNA-binding NarL/FixJ family response regulator